VVIYSRGINDLLTQKLGPHLHVHVALLTLVLGHPART